MSLWGMKAFTITVTQTLSSGPPQRSSASIVDQDRFEGQCAKFFSGRHGAGLPVTSDDQFHGEMLLMGFLIALESYL